MRSTPHFAVAVLLLGPWLAGACPSGRASAQDQEGDGAYGRFDSDATLASGIGVGLAADGAVLTGELSLRYLDAVGPAVALVGGLSGDSFLLTSLELRPLFPARFLLDGMFGSERWDLLVDSLTVELGAASALRGSRPGVALVVGLHLGIPLFTAAPFGRGVYLQLGIRHLRSAAEDRASPGAITLWIPTVSLIFAGPLQLGLVARETPRYHATAISDVLNRRE